MAGLDPRTRACLATLEETKILVHGESIWFATTVPKMATGGKAYSSSSLQGRLIASTAQARESGTSDTNCVNLFLILIANKSEDGATWYISTERPLEGETTLFG